MIPNMVLADMVKRIHAFPELHNCIVGFHGDGMSRVLFEPKETLTGYEDLIGVIIEETSTEEEMLIAELDRWAESQGISQPGAPNPRIVTNRNKLAPELIGAGLSCGLTVVSAIGLVGGVAAEVPSAGTSTFLVIAGWTGLAMSGIQCVNGIVRVGAIINDPEADTLDRWDKNVYYSTTILIVDAIGVATSLASLPSQTRNLMAILSRQKSFVARGLSFESLRNMNRAERLKVLSELFEEAARTPEGRRALVQQLRELKVSGSFQGANGLSVRGAQNVGKAIGAETARRLSASLRDVVAAGLGVTASGLPSDWVGSASGSVNTATAVIVNIVDTSRP